MSNPSKEYEGISYSKITQDIMRPLLHTTWKYYLGLGITFALVAQGALVLYYQTTRGLGVWGTNDPVVWGLDISGFIFWVGFSFSGTLISAVLLLTHADWRRPLARSAEAQTLFAIMVALMIPFGHLSRPWRFFYGLPYPNFRQIWPDFRSPLTWDILSITTYMIGTAILLYAGAIPDFAVVRDNTTGWRKRLYTILSLGWKGSGREWRHFHRAYLILAALMIPVAASVHSVVSWIASNSIMPGMHSTIFAPYFIAGALFSGTAGVVIIMIFLRRGYHFQDYIKPSHFNNLGKLLLVLSLIWAYINIIELMIPWFKEISNFELMALASKVKGSYAPMYWTMILFNGIIPLSLFSQKVRTNLRSIFVIAVLIEVGMAIERYLLIVPGLNVGYLPAAWSSYRPTWVEYSLLIGGIAWFAFLFLIFIKIFPAISFYELKEVVEAPQRLKPAYAAPAASTSVFSPETPEMPNPGNPGEEKKERGENPKSSETPPDAEEEG